MLLPFTPDWRWLLDRLDSPWYPTARLFRQDDTRAWDNVIARVHEALRDFIQCRSELVNPALRAIEHDPGRAKPSSSCKSVRRALVVMRETEYGRSCVDTTGAER